jgi:hypothetical protein
VKSALMAGLAKFPPSDNAVYQDLRIGLKNLSQCVGACDANMATWEVSLEGT